MTELEFPGGGPSSGSAAARFPSRHLAPPVVRDLPPAPRSIWPIIGPGVVAAGVGLASGEFILYPYIASQVGLVFVWAAFVGLITQFFINMEIERYTLATGETALTGFSRFWRHWGLVFALMAYFANLWPGWATSSATLVTYLVGGEVTPIAIGMLLSIGVILTLAPVVYVALERIEMGKVVAVLLLLVIGLTTAIDAQAWGDVPQIVTNAAIPSEQLGFALLMGALAFAGAGGGQNLCQSNWIRDKGFGMGTYVPRIVSPVTGEPEAAPSTGYVFEPTQRNLAQWRQWWKMANVEQLVTFVAITFLTILFTSLLAYATVFGRPGLASDITFIQAEGEALSAAVGGWFGTLFWVVGAFSLYAAAVGIVDYTSRLGADVLKVGYLRRATESKIYFVLVWGLVLFGCVILLVGVTQPIVLLVISAVVGGFMMFIYSGLLAVLNRRVLPEAIRPGALRVGALVWAVLLFGVLSALTFDQQIRNLLGAE
ncbi:Nramp family divalent metal transporter [Quadrisphaera sp. DSM 44207]|uniref:Nramp family divalent metal transporter n=1 Tax=Quadrisphaera sp. DSM 44207 TaxID=1881057 RepID=UPI00088D7D8B|nr:Nramp family divalent metal transporter [Quadrisphaera sp. DSM 44207]SDQ84784.1 Mn2+ and Fe2+ transporters of the NRAMP family [Quadrisphaera sp. DSM 44207]